jgi:hypothetical protein
MNMGMRILREMCQERLEVDSGQIKVLNLKPEEARTAVQHLQRKRFPHSQNDEGARKVAVTQ